jgi:hypothetical protein
MTERLAPRENVDALPPVPPETGDRLRPPMRHLSPKTRVGNFNQVEKGFTRKQAIEEASRCLRCDLEFTQPAPEPVQAGTGTNGSEA